MDSEADARTFTLKEFSKRPSVPGLHPEDEFYKMSHKNRGLALIFNHRTFKFERDRTGTEFDRDAMKHVLGLMGFHVEVHDDLSRDKLMGVLTVAAAMDHTDNDCLVVTIMSHGKSGGRICSHDRDYYLSELLDWFSGTNCPSLAGKPKLFFIQACRGDKTDEGVTLQTDTIDGARVNKPKVFYTIPSMADILIMHGTIDGHVSWRDGHCGSWFIQSLAKHLEQHHKTRDLISMLTLVNKDVAIGYESKHGDPMLDKKKEMCSIVSMLTRTVRFD